MNTKVVILPMDGYANYTDLAIALQAILNEPESQKLLAFIKLNDGIHQNDVGSPEVISIIHNIIAKQQLDIGIFLDLKIFDVSATMVNVLKKFLAVGNKIGILTVSASCSLDGIIKLRKLLPETKLAMVSALTDMSEDECQRRFGQSPAVKIYNDLINIEKIYCNTVNYDLLGKYSNPFDLVVCSSKELDFLTTNLRGYGFIVPGIRDEWMKKADEHQKRVTGVAEALSHGATFVVMGAQMTKGNPEKGISAATSRRLTIEQIKKSQGLVYTDENALKVLKECDGYYCSLKNPDNSYCGPLVGYAGTYEDENGKKRNYVGFEYFNFAKAEQKPQFRNWFARAIKEKLIQANIAFDVLAGAPMGGIMLASELGGISSKHTIFAEKKVIAAANLTEGQKEKSELVIDRHELRAGDKVILVEDVCNNFSTTEKIQKLIEDRGAILMAIACAFNRSGKKEWNGIPVISACYIPTQQFKQDAPEVIQHLAAENIVWKAKSKEGWAELREAMAE